ncbi:MAG TPA: hypothetical protein VKD69_20305 [Vicinamibacterales bacterium]|nr:hypothetical protein [Vicinamibacterales bacterium]
MTTLTVLMTADAVGGVWTYALRVVMFHLLAICDELAMEVAVP